MLAPKISIRQLLWSMVAIALFLALASSAWRGNVTTFGQTIAILTLPVVFLVYACAYWLLFAVACWSDRLRRDRWNLRPLSRSQKTVQQNAQMATEQEP